MKKIRMAAAMAVIVLTGINGAVEARCEGAMGMQVVEFAPSQVNLGMDPRLAGLAGAAGAIGAAAYSGDAQAAEERLAALFSGSGIRAAAAPVYTAPRPGAPAVSRAIPVAQLPKTVYKSALEDLGDTEDGEDREDEDIKPSNAEDADAAAKGDAAAAGAGASPGPLWQTLLAGVLGIMVMLMFTGFFPASLLFV